MIILGIGFLSEASAALVKDGELVAAVSEERLNRRKLWYGFPEEAIAAVLDIAGISIGDVDLIATHGLANPVPDKTPYDEKRRLIDASDLSDADKKTAIDFLDRRYQHECHVFGERTPNYIATIRSLGRPVKIYAHHHAHAATAYYGSGWDDCLVMTADGWGEDGSHTFYDGRPAETPADCLKLLSFTPTIDSLGYFYGSITKALGYKPHRHEGKVLGLAAHCQDPKSYESIRNMIDADVEGGKFVGHIERGLYLPHFDNLKLLALAQRYGRHDLSAAAQQSLEDVVCQLVASRGPQAKRLALAGGIFANVKLNQRLAELDNVDEVYVFPNMGDGGLSVGAAWLAHHEYADARPKPPTTMYLGHDTRNDEIGDVLQKAGLNYELCNNIYDRVGELLAEGHVVARCAGRMEFGPRALGHRSILYKATDPSVNEWLNDKLDRSEFMPFAPATLAEHADEFYQDMNGARTSAEFMTLTFNCTQKMRDEAPAAVHVDNTARPQIVHRDRHLDMYAIIANYRQRTGLSSVINTSFNMHEEPIVCSAEDSVRAFVSGELPYLAIGDFLVKRHAA